MIKNNVAIFGYPRSGTKLLSLIYQQQSYFCFGSFFDTFTSNISINENGLPYTINRDISIQKKEQARRYRIGFKNDDREREVIGKIRLEQFLPYRNISPTTITIYLEDFQYIPNLYDALSNRFFLCTRRKNKFEQLLSNYVSWYNLNYWDEIESKKVTVDPLIAELYATSLIECESLQDKLVNDGLGRYVDFDKLICGTEELGFKYDVTSKDHNSDLRELITNLDEVRRLVSKIIDLDE